MHLDEALSAEIIAHAREVAPAECCGLIGGMHGQARSVYRAHNAAVHRGRYELDPHDQFRILERMRAAGEQLVAVYHSHPRSPAVPSAEDVEMGRRIEAVQLIVSLMLGDELPIVRAYRIAGGRPVGVELVTEELARP